MLLLYSTQVITIRADMTLNKLWLFFHVFLDIQILVPIHYFVYVYRHSVKLYILFIFPMQT